MNRKIVIVLLIGIIAAMAVKLEQNKVCFDQKLAELKIENELLQKRIFNLQGQQKRIWDRLDGWLDEWDVEEIELTGYAPLDPRAVPGLCYFGNPKITSSGNPVIIGETAAAGVDLPFGTWVLIKDYGFKKITDRGGMVNRNPNGLRQIDIAVGTQEEAREIGRRNTWAIVKKP